MSKSVHHYGYLKQPGNEYKKSVGCTMLPTGFFVKIAFEKNRKISCGTKKT